jgi:uncharacterized protein
MRSAPAFQGAFSRLDRQQNWSFLAHPQPQQVNPMSFSIYDASIPPMIRMLQSIAKVMDKAVAQTKSEDKDLSTLLDARLAPDMHPFPRQIQIMSDAAKGAAARLAGIEAPAMPDTETTFPELQARISKTIDFLKSVKPEQLSGAEDRKIELKSPNRTLEFNGRDFLTQFALPNFYFHATTAYGLLRHKGIAIGKTDYLGG